MILVIITLGEGDNIKSWLKSKKFITLGGFLSIEIQEIILYCVSMFYQKDNYDCDVYPDI